MVRCKAIDTSPRFLAVDLERQLLPGSFEHALNHLLDHEFDLSLLIPSPSSRAYSPSAAPPEIAETINIRAPSKLSKGIF